MKKQIYIGIVASVLAVFVLFGFNNCSDDVAFKKIEEYTLDESSEQEIINTLPPEEVGIRRPLTDLENDPSLYEIFRCPDSDGVVICHFPENVESEVTQCVGRPAVSTHYDHIRDYVMDNENRTTSDYLGPCRFPL